MYNYIYIYIYMYVILYLILLPGIQFVDETWAPQNHFTIFCLRLAGGLASLGLSEGFEAKL